MARSMAAAELAMPEPIALESSASETRPTTETVRWSLAACIGFRFAFSYFVLYTLQGGSFLGRLPGMQWFSTATQSIWPGLSQWVAIHWFHLSGPVITPPQTGSGDNTIDYVLNFCVLLLALFATFCWSVLDRRRENYARMHFWLRIWLRYTLAFTLFGYGFAKVFPLQMRPSSLAG